MGFDVLLVGVKRKNPSPLMPRKYKMFRFNNFFKEGVFFFVELNVRLFFYLLFKKCNILVSNDLDTLLPNVLISRLKRKELVYDSHEYFTEVAELIARPQKQAIWKCVERYCFPKLKHIFTVSESIAEIYRKEYGKEVKVVRNIPLHREYTVKKTRKKLGLSEDKFILLVQGTGINLHRGIEELVESMLYIENALLLIIGNGTAIKNLKEKAKSLSLENKILFMNRMPFDELYNYTVHADIGFSLDKDIGINHRFALPNKLFDFIRARVPLIVSDLVEIRKIVEQYNIGIILPDSSPQTIAKYTNALLNDHNKRNALKNNTIRASEELCWENEEKILKEVYSSFLSPFI
jgi:glycosyltransferase involved in cell wall biosynthesis